MFGASTWKKTDIRSCVDVVHLVVPNSSPATNMLLHIHRMHNDSDNGARRVAEGTKVHKSCFGSVQFPRRIRPERDPIS
jgi:hypothetical protein